MSWEFLISAILGVVIIFLMVMTVLFYAQHWRGRRKNEDDTPQNPLQGRYFKRYISMALRDKYEEEFTTSDQTKSEKKNLSNQAWTVMVVLISVAISVAFVMYMGESLSPPTSLTDNEIKQISMRKYQWRPQKQFLSYSMSNSLKASGFKTITVVNSKTIDDQVIENGLNFSKVAEEQWQRWAKGIGLKYRSCHWRNLHRCRINFKSTIVVMIPGTWNTPKINKLLKNGASLVLYGPPSQIYAKKNNREFEVSGLRFERFSSSEGSDVLLVGDRPLTLGIDAGYRIPLKPLSKSYRVHSETSDALRGTPGTVTYEEKIGTRLYSTAVNKGRLVWLDFSPNSEDHRLTHQKEVFAGIKSLMIRFLSRQESQSIAMWPGGKKFVAFVEQDTEHRFHRSTRLIDYVENKKFPISFFALSHLGDKNVNVVKDMNQFGSFSCHGDNHDRFDRDSQRTQTIRLATCQKALKNITSKLPLGFRPPEEGFNDATLNSMYNVGMKFLFAGINENSLSPMFYVDNNANAKILYVGRANADDYTFYEFGDPVLKTAQSRISKEIKWIKKSGGVYAYSIHSQYIDRKNFFPILDYIVDTLREQNAQIMELNDLHDWWSLRKSVQKKEKVEWAKLYKFQPMLVKVEPGGNIKMIPLSSKRKRADGS